MTDESKTGYLPVIEERVSLTARRVAGDRVRVATRTEQIDHILPAELSSVEVDVTRVPVDRRIDGVPDVVTQGDLTIIPVVEERLVLTRELYLREEIHVRRVERSETVEVPATTRRQTVQIERIPADLANPPTRTIKMTYDNEAGTVGTTSVSAMFDSQADAQSAVDRLVQAGIPSARIRQVAGGSDTNSNTATTQDRDKGFWDSLSDFFFPDEDRYTYAEGLSRGGYLVTVTGLSGSEYDTALDILDDEGSVNLDERAESWRSEGWGGYESSSYASGSTAAAYGTAAGTRSGVDSDYIDSDSLRGDDSLLGDDSLRGYDSLGGEDSLRGYDTLQGSDSLRGDETIPIIEERIRVGKRETGHGRVRVRAYTVEEPVNESVDLRQERVEIERRPVDRAVTGDDAAFQDRTLEAEEYREEAVVQKEARVVEEIGLRKTSDTHRETVSDTVRRTEVEVEDDRGDLTRGDDLDRNVLNRDEDIDRKL